MTEANADIMADFPFTISSDIDLGRRLAVSSVSSGADVAIREGEVPTAIEATQTGATYLLNHREFLLDLPDGSRFYVRNGEEIVYSRGSASGDGDMALFILGTAFGALCYQRGLIPIHASAVLIDGRISAITGHSGAGKSTLAANLARRGHSFFSDDTVIFDPSAASDSAICYAGQKQLKLWNDAIAVTGAEKLDPVREFMAIDKHYAMPANPSSIYRAELAKLLVLRRTRGDSAHPNQIEPIKGSNALRAIQANFYRPHFAETILGRGNLFRALKILLETVEIARFTRERGDENYERAIDYAENWIASSNIDRSQ